MQELSTIGYILLFTFIGSIASLAGGFILFSKDNFAKKFSHLIAAFAAGTLLGTTFFELFPEAAHEAEGTGIDIFLWALVAIILFFLIERFSHWFHHHTHNYDNHIHDKPTRVVPLIVLSDTIHNFIDGIVIAATFMINPTLGITTALAIAAHEIPQEIGDFGLLLHEGLSKKKVILINIISASAAFLGAILVILSGDFIEGYIPVFLALTGGFFIYIATADLIPEIHHEKDKKLAIKQSLLLIFGAAIIWVSLGMLPHEH